MIAPGATFLAALDRPSEARCGPITGRQVREARALLRWTRGDFSRATALPVRVLDRAEAAEGEPSVTRGQSIVIRHALEKAGIVFTAEAPGVRLRRGAPA